MNTKPTVWSVSVWASFAIATSTRSCGFASHASLSRRYGLIRPTGSPTAASAIPVCYLIKDQMRHRRFESASLRHTVWDASLNYGRRVGS